eukprot:CAMPEP_0170609646 /NCGR_PEP_ID=MMETSP0224-20130122/22236_1 /TAXON_ID=285029 /ORGANISM="Togula jolla, Strain CCCM 725" /LENGTH=370 /DNA_ID=CAMNT_0010934967 /DNA_START=172 /DNA_END=1284 /DNA_ORIENTATION=+
MRSVGIDGEEKDFTKPWFGTFNMLFAMTLVGLIDVCIARSQRWGQSKRSPLIDASPGMLTLDEDNDPDWGRKVCTVAYPAAFDLLATALCCMGILYIPASVWQMLRGASMVFCAIFSITFLKRTLWCFNWLGLFLCTLGVTLVGFANVLSGGAKAGDKSDPNDLIFGMGLVIMGQVVQAAQVIAEEYLMKDVNLPAMTIIGFEGVWGILMMFLIAYPILWFVPGPDGGHVEDPFDTVVMLYHSPKLLIIIALYLAACGLFNATGIAVTGALSSVHRMMLDASRTTVIWAFGLAVWCYDPDSEFGEAWTEWSFLQLIGFTIMVFGQAIYGEVLRVPGLRYPKAYMDMDASQWASPTGMMNMASPPPRVDIE